MAWCGVVPSDSLVVSVCVANIAAYLENNMDCNQKFCLRWNNFQNSVTSVFDNLRQDEELVDITLCCEGKKIKAHRLMLSACSPYFRDLLKENPCQHPVFFLKDTLYPDLAAVVEFVYKGEVNVTQSQLGSFLKTAEMLQVRGLAGEDEGVPSQPPSHTLQTAHPPVVQPPAGTPLSPARGRFPPPAAPPEPALKRRRVSLDSGSPERADPQQSAEAAAKVEVSVKLEHEDNEADSGLEAAFGMGATVYEAASFDVGSSGGGGGVQDVAGILSQVAEQGGSGGGDMSQHTPGTSEEGAPQGTWSTVRRTTRRWRRQEVLRRPDGRVICPVCGKTFSGLTSLGNHRPIHDGDTTCSFCGRVYGSRHNLRVHMLKSHGETLPPLPPREQRELQQHQDQEQEQEQEEGEAYREGQHEHGEKQGLQGAAEP